LEHDEQVYDAYGNNILTSYYSWDSNTSQWFVSAKYTSYYSEHNSGISERYINVFPNPAKESIIFYIADISESATVEIFDNQGRRSWNKSYLLLVKYLLATWVRDCICTE